MGGKGQIERRGGGYIAVMVAVSIVCMLEMSSSKKQVK